MNIDFSNHKKRNFVYFLCALIGLLLLLYSTHLLTQPRIFGILTYLNNHIAEDGEYDYEYYPKEDFVGYTEHLIRHTATAYALAAYMLEKDSLLLNQLYKNHLEKAMSYTLAQKRPCLPNAADTGCLYFSYEHPTLGANAFAIMALSNIRKLPVISNDTKESCLKEMVLLEEYLSLSFTNDSLIFNDEIDETSKRYQGGQVLMAWVRLYEATGDTKYLDKANILMKGIITKMNETKDYKLHHWLWLGLKDYYLVTEQNLSPEVLGYVVKSAEKLLNSQRQDPSDQDYGTFTDNDEVAATDSTDEGTHPRETSSQSVKIEGLGSLLYLLNEGQACMSNNLCQRLEEGIVRGIPVLDTEQLDIKDVFKEFSLDSFGGFPLHRKSSVIQIDNLQHALAAYQVFYSLDK